MAVDALITAFKVLRWIHDSVQSIKTSRTQLELLYTCAEKLLTTLDTEFTESRLVPQQCSKALEDLVTLLHDIHRFVKAEEDSGFLKILLQKDGRLSKIEAFYRRIGMSVAAFQIPTLLNIQTMLAESKQAQAQDTKDLHTYLSVLETNSTELLRRLEINQNNTIAMMVCLQNQLKKRNVDREEQEFYTHTLEYLGSWSGKQVEVKRWMIAPLEVEYDDSEEIGAGGFGKVFRGTWNGTEVVIKVLRNEAGVKPSPAAFQTEIDIWSELRHPNIVQFLGANKFDDKPFIVMPYLPYNAKDFLAKQPTFERLSILRDISLGLQYLHSQSICHGDLKGINVLVDNSERALLCDFGLARLRADTTARTSIALTSKARTSTGDALQIHGSRYWMAPELLDGRSPPTRSSDVYAFGMVVYELYTGEIPLFWVPYNDFVNLVVHHERRPERPKYHKGPANTR
ncbi:Kinase-like protein [Mycena sanguinolenta]|uniref:Kinase-like protein n=1 Tax=Mycena sanguinolenta TaxID=230812 RepID=A0A8H6XWS2_9AGAR|nr:Kinase-like protein [Mycena sanguinolenta]